PAGGDVMDAGAPVFRLLDERVGWDPRPGDGLRDVVTGPGGLQLAALPGAGDPAAALAARLVHPGGDGSWWLGTDTGIRRLSPCDAAFRLRRRTGPVLGLAARGRLLAVLLASGAVLVLDLPGGFVVGEAQAPGGRSVRFASAGPVVLGAGGVTSL